MSLFDLTVVALCVVYVYTAGRHADRLLDAMLWPDAALRWWLARRRPQSKRKVKRPKSARA